MTVSFVKPSMFRHMRTPARILAAVLVAMAMAAGTPARAEDNFDLAVTQGQVTLTAKGEWHINTEFPWKLVIGDTKLDKSKFSLSEKTATVAAPKGSGKLRGAVCSKDQCVKVEKDITVP